MKRILLFCVFIFSLIGHRAEASHVVGAHITYQYTGSGNDYLFKVRFYRDCAGIPAPPSAFLSFASTCYPAFVATLQLITVNQIPLNPCAGFGTTSCLGGTIFGFEEYNYEGVVNVLPCNNWVVSYNTCCRNSLVTNVINAATYSNYVETTFDNLNFPGNSSPMFFNTPVNYYCTGFPSMKDYGAIDIDGDSLHYELVPVLTDQVTPIPMAPGFTYDQPLAVTLPITFDSTNGIMLFTPSMIQVGALAYRISEYRNGVLIGTVRAEDEIVVATGILNPDTITGRVFYDSNANGVFDATDQPAANRIIQAMPGNLLTATSGAGKYEFFTMDGNWDISIPNLPLYTTVNPSSISINTTGISSSNSNDFILEPIPNINDLTIHLYNLGNPLPGQNYNLEVIYENPGTVIPLNVEITLTLDSLLQYVTANPAPANVAGNTLTWQMPSLPLFFSGNIHVQTLVDSIALLGSLIFCGATIIPVVNDYTPLNNSTERSVVVANSYDPNNKEVTPAGDLPLAFVTAQNWLNYRINFQNIGTAPAQMVRIMDLLDTDLEYSTLEFVAASYPCNMLFTGPNKLEFTFYGINLPAASVNEPGSHGFVEFRIRPKATLTPGTYITNNAGIYFDFNSPIYTNIVQSKVVISVGMEETVAENESFQVYPNPATDNITLDIYREADDKAEIEIYNTLGSLIKKTTRIFSAGINLFTIPVSDLPDGNYFLLVRGKCGREVRIVEVLHER